MLPDIVASKTLERKKNQLILINFSYSTPVRNSKYLAIPPNPLPLRNIKMAPNVN